MAIRVNTLLLIEFRVEGEIDIDNIFNLEPVRLSAVDIGLDVINDFQLIAGIEPIVPPDHAAFGNIGVGGE